MTALYCAEVGKPLQSKLFICTLLKTNTLSEALLQALRDTPHTLTQFESEDRFLEFIEQEPHSVDCLILEDAPDIEDLLFEVHRRLVMLPVIVLELGNQGRDPEQAIAAALSSLDDQSEVDRPYSQAVLRLSLTQLGQLEQFIDQAISQFLKLSLTNGQRGDSLSSNSADSPVSLRIQQRRLSEKLKERLGYLGVYYKRNPKNFLRNLPPQQRKEFLQRMKAEYRAIILVYFSPETKQLNEKIDNLVNAAFFADVSVSQLVEIHMALMDDFAKQLKLEGRSEEILLDYRLTLIDTIAHLCEMYRRSIPRES
jgi:circadian clock protein KaiA